MMAGKSAFVTGSNAFYDKRQKKLNASLKSTFYAVINTLFKCPLSLSVKGSKWTKKVILEKSAVECITVEN